MPSNADAFARQLELDGDRIVREDAPRKLADLTLEAAQIAADLAPRGDAQLLARHNPKRERGALAASWSAGQQIARRYSDAGLENSRAALAAPTLDKSFFIYSLDFIAGFHEFGTEKMRATPMLAPALQEVGSRVVE